MAHNWGGTVPAHNAYNTGDKIERTVGGQTESVRLPPIDLGHLRTAMVDGKKVRGFHILSSAVALFTSTSPLTLAAGAVTVVDLSGVPMPGAQIRLTPLRVPADGYDAFEARVEVLDATGAVLASDAAKSFYPQEWTEAQIQEAIYSAYADDYRSGGSPFFFRRVLTTPEGVAIEMRVSGSQSASGITLRRIPTAYLQPGQHLTVGDTPPPP